MTEGNDRGCFQVTGVQKECSSSCTCPAGLVCELAGEWNEWQCPLRGAQRRILIKCCFLPSLTNTASMQWRGEAFGSKALSFRHQTRGKGWGQVSLAGTGPHFFPYMIDGLQKFWESVGAFTMLVRLCCKACFSSFTIWVTVRVPTAEKGCVKTTVGRRSSRSASRMFADGQCMADSEDSKPLVLQRCQCLTHPLGSVNKM